MKKLILFLSIMLAQTSFGALTETDKQIVDKFKELSYNGGFENGAAGWTASGGATAAVNTTAKGTGSLGFDWDSNSSGQTLVSKSITIPNGLLGRNGFFSCNIKTVSGTATHTITVNDGTNDITPAFTIQSSTTGFISTYSGSPGGQGTFVFPGSGTIRLKLTSVASNEPEIYIDDCNIGLADAPGGVTGSVSQAVLLGGVKVTGCAGSWQKAAAGSTLVAYTAQTGCSYSTFGSAAADTAFGSTQLPAIKFASMPAGEYRIEYEGTIGPNGTGGTVQSNQFTDGTITAREISYVVEANSAAGQASGISQSFSYTSPKTNVTWQLFSAVNDANNTQVFGTTAKPGVFKVYYFPASSQQAVSSANADYDRTAYTPTFGAGFGTPTGVSFFHLRRGGDLFVFGNFTTGTVAASAGTFSLPAGLSIDTTRVTASNTSANPGQCVGELDAQGAANLKGCIVTATGTSTTLVYLGGAIGSTAKLTPTGSVSGSFGLSSSQVVSVSFRVPISGWNENQRAPTLVGSITSNSTGANRLEYATVTSTCSSSPCTIAGGNSGGWLTNITRSAAGTYSVNFASGTFSAVPHCWATNFTVNRHIIGNGDTTTSAYSFQTNDDVDAKFSVGCIGPR